MTNAENILLELQNGVHRWVLILFAVAIVLSYPSYLLGSYASSFWFYSSNFNTSKFDNRNIVSNKKIVEKEVSLDTPSYIDLVNNQRLIYSFLNNRQNKTVGYNPFVYKLQVLDENGTVLSDEIKTTYLLPGEAKYIAAYTNSSKAVSLSIQKMPESDAVDYNPEANPFLREPELDIREKTIEEKNKTTLLLKTSFKNSTKFFIQDVDVTILIRDSQDSVVGIQDYKMSGLVSGENRDIRLEYPKPKNRTAKSLDVRYSVNYLNSNAIILR